jgi:hypothetical protein
MDNTSLYADAEPVRRGRKAGAALLDYLTLMILTLLLYVASEAIGQSTATVKNLTAEASGIRENLYSLVEESKLDETDPDSGNLVGSAALAKRYIISATLASLEKNGVTDISKTTYDGYEAIKPETDNAYFFYVTFKQENKNNFSSSDESINDSGTAFYRDLLVQKSDVDGFEREGYPYLFLKTAKAIDSYLRDENYVIGKNAYECILSGYQQVLSLGTQEFIQYYTPYVNVNSQYTAKTSLLYRIRHGELLASYALGILLVFFVAPLILKDGMTTTDKILKIGVATVHGHRPPWYLLLLHSALLGIAYLSVLPLVFLCYYGVDGLSLFDSSLIPHLSLLVLGLSSLLIILFSFLLTFINPSRKQTISEFLSSLVSKDGREFTVSRTMGEERVFTDGKH